MKKYETAFDVFREELKHAILTEEVPMTVRVSTYKPYIATVEISLEPFCKDETIMSVAPTFVCYHNPFLTGFFDDEDDLAALNTLVRKYLPSEQELSEVEELQHRLDELKGKAFSKVIPVLS